MLKMWLKNPEQMFETALLKMTFLEMDTDRDGYLTREEMQSGANKLSADKVDEMFQKLDKNHDGKINFESGFGVSKL